MCVCVCVCVSLHDLSIKRTTCHLTARNLVDWLLKEIQHSVPAARRKRNAAAGGWSVDKLVYWPRRSRLVRRVVSAAALNYATTHFTRDSEERREKRREKREREKREERRETRNQSIYLLTLSCPLSREGQLFIGLSESGHLIRYHVLLYVQKSYYSTLTPRLHCPRVTSLSLSLSLAFSVVPATALAYYLHTTRVVDELLRRNSKERIIMAP